MGITNPKINRFHDKTGLEITNYTPEGSQKQREKKARITMGRVHTLWATVCMIASIYPKTNSYPHADIAAGSENRSLFQ